MLKLGKPTLGPPRNLPNLDRKSVRIILRRGVSHLSMLTPYLVIGLGAFLGANCRYLVGGWAANLYGAGFPYGTLIVNLSGSFIIGFFVTLITGRLIAPPNVRLFFVVGFLGAFTTFSSFTFESLGLIQSRAYVAALVNLLGSVTVGMIAVTLGAVLGGLV